MTTKSLPDDRVRNHTTPPSSEPRLTLTAKKSRRGLLGRAALATTAAILGAGAGAEATHWRDTRLSPTARTAPRPAAPGSALGTRVVFQTGGESGKLALTFDDGPDPRWTPRVLDMLARLHVQATFFVLGSAVEAHPELIAREVAEGHEVAVHNWVHTDVYGVSFSELSDSGSRTCESNAAAGAPSPRPEEDGPGAVERPHAVDGGGGRRQGPCRCRIGSAVPRRAHAALSVPVRRPGRRRALTAGTRTYRHDGQRSPGIHFVDLRRPLSTSRPAGRASEPQHENTG